MWRKLIFYNSVSVQLAKILFGCLSVVDRHWEHAQKEKPRGHCGGCWPWCTQGWFSLPMTESWSSNRKTCLTKLWGLCASVPWSMCLTRDLYSQHESEHSECSPRQSALGWQSPLGSPEATKWPGWGQTSFGLRAWDFPAAVWCPSH